MLPSTTEPRASLMAAIVAAVVREIWGAEPVYTREGGSVPVVTQFARVLKVPTVMFGFGLPDDNLHAPNEKYHLPNFYKGIDTVIAWVERVGGTLTS